MLYTSLIAPRVFIIPQRLLPAMLGLNRQQLIAVLFAFLMFSSMIAMAAVSL